MNKFDPGLIAEIKARLRIEDVVGRYVELRHMGTRLVAPCPFHQETKPSFSVSADRGFYYCFGCQASGDIIEFYRVINGLEFGEAVEALAKEAGLVVDRPRTVAGSGPSQAHCLDMHALATTFFQRVLKSAAGQMAREYLARRGLTSKIVEDFSLGWAPAGWNGLRDELRRQGFGDEVAEKAGLVSKSAKGGFYDRFRERLIFPIMSLSGQVVAFGGRSLLEEQGPKYLNSSETPIYTKGEHLYGLRQARRAMSHSKSVFLSEGYVDVLSLHQFGFENSCGVLGTALTPEQVHRLLGLVGQVDLIFDGDAAGRKAALRSAEMILVQGLKCRVLCLPEGEDVDSVLQKSGRPGLEGFIASAVDGLSYCLQQVAVQSPRDMLQWATGFIGRLKKLDWRSYYIPKLAAGLGLSEQDLRKALPAPQDATSRMPREKLEFGGPAQRDRELLAFVVRFPEYIAELQALGLEQALATKRGKKFWGKLVGTDPRMILSTLDQGEKEFYVQCQIRADVTAEDGEREWDEMRSFLHHTGQRREVDHLTEQLRQAQLAGNFEEELQILALIQNRTQDQ